MACGTEQKRDRGALRYLGTAGIYSGIPGASIDYETVAKDIADILSDCDIKALAFDRWHFDLLKKKWTKSFDLPLLLRLGRDLKTWRQQSTGLRNC